MGERDSRTEKGQYENESRQVAAAAKGDRHGRECVLGGDDDDGDKN
jgi:hypothetical protein